MHWLWYLILAAVQFIGLSLTLIGLPGNWVMVAALIAFGWMTGWNVYVGWASVGAALGLAVTGELLEFLAGSAGAKKAGGSGRATIGAIVGGIVGGIVFSIPLPIIGTIFGVCLGAFLGATIIEMGLKRNASHAARVGWGAAKGSFWGIVLKLLVGLVIAIVAIVAALPW